ncbi:hypothetical protein [Streptomyces atratus]|uniref:hypothetical protein n=1 Tax=Streptomyces atratus TaxID=1893 RepID=UPI003406E303
MESGPAVFAGTTFTLFGTALLVWTGARVVHRAPVAHEVRPVVSATLATLFGVLCLLLGVGCLTRI